MRKKNVLFSLLLAFFGGGSSDFVWDQADDFSGYDGIGVIGKG